MASTTRKFKVELSAAERQELEAIVRQQSVGVAKHRRARILLLSDVNHPQGRRTDATIAELVHISERQVKRIRQQLVRERESKSVVNAWGRVVLAAPPRWTGRLPPGPPIATPAVAARLGDSPPRTPESNSEAFTRKDDRYRWIDHYLATFG